MSGRRWAAAEIETLCAMYPDNTTTDIAQKLKRTESQIYNKAYALGLKKSATYLSGPTCGRLDGIRGRQTRFQKGQQAWNKGLKGLALGGKATQFKPGNLPHNHVSIGSIITDRDGYLHIKVADPDRWRLLHQKTWEDQYGPIPVGMVLVFRDRNLKNCALNNLELISRPDLMRRNSIHRYPSELIGVMRLTKKLWRKTHEQKHK